MLNEFVGDIISYRQGDSNSVIDTHDHNGIAKRAIMTVSNMLQTMMLKAELCWPGTANTSL